MFLPVAEPVHGLLQRNLLQPVFVGVFLVLDLIHDTDGVSPVRVHRLIEGDRVHNGIQGKDHLFPL